MQRAVINEEEAVAHLRIMGLNLYESRAYLALVKARELTAKGVGQTALIPQSRTYDVLESLSKKGLAMATPGSPATYVPVSPAKVLGPRYGAEKKKIQEGAVRIQQEAQGRLERLQEAYAYLTSSFPAKRLEGSVTRDRVWVLQTREGIEEALIGLIRDSKSTVMRITKPPSLGDGEPLDPFYIVGMENRRYLYDALDRKVKMNWLSLEGEIPSFSGLVVEEPPERRYIENAGDITEKFLLVDGRSVLLNLHDPASSAYGSVALAMESKAAASIFLDHFEKVWEKGKPLEDVLPRMKRLVADTSAKLQEIGFSRVDTLLYRALARLGAVSRDVLVNELSRKKMHPQDSSESCDRLIKLGLVRRDSIYRLLLVEHPAKVAEAIANGSITSPSEKPTTALTASGRNPQLSRV
ncbi:MAG TPA: helix-turn-helix domain-containing protein [Nitrososphaerales archaeon]